MTDPESIKDDERLAIKREVARLVRDVGGRTSRAGRLGCAWVVFVSLSALSIRHTGGFFAWAFFSVASFIALGRFVKNDTSRSVAEFQRTFRSIGGDANRREIAVSYLRTLAQPAGRKPNKHAQKLLKGLGASVPLPTPIVRVLSVEGVRAPAHVHAPPVVAPQTTTPLTVPFSAPSPARDAPATPSHSTRSAHSTAASPTRSAHPAPVSRMPTEPSPTPSTSPSPRTEPTPMVDPRVPASLSVLGPPPPAPEVHIPAATSTPAPAATSTPLMDALVSWRCDACGTGARVPRAEAHRLCPTCFPQIRLDV